RGPSSAGRSRWTRRARRPRAISRRAEAVVVDVLVVGTGGHVTYAVAVQVPARGPLRPGGTRRARGPRRASRTARPRRALRPGRPRRTSRPRRALRPRRARPTLDPLRPPRPLDAFLPGLP